jgi:hypothetical protein
MAARHGPQNLPLDAEQPVSVSNTAKAINPANQNSIVRVSAARIPYLCAAVGYRLGVMTTYAIARRVQTEVKIRKLI